MKNPKIIAPVKCTEDIRLTATTKCDSVYLCSCRFLDKSSHEQLFELIKEARLNNLDFFINFKKISLEDNLTKAKDLIEFLLSTSIDGIIVNSLDILEIIKEHKLPFKVFIDSGLNIHNLSGIEFINLFHHIENINITEEIYLKNIIKIKKYSRAKLSIDSDNLPWIAEEIKKSKAVDYIFIKGNFKTPKELIDAIGLVEKITKTPNEFANKKLPFGNFESFYYKSNHFSGEFQNSAGKDFKFAGNIQQFSRKFKNIRLKKPITNNIDNLPRLNLRLTSLDQFKSLKSYLRKLRFNPVYSLEYGEIVDTADLAKKGFNKIIEKVKNDCIQYGIKFQLSTPRILTERDFDRVYEYVKLSYTKDPAPSSIVINNLGYLWAIINDPEFENIPIELGYGLNLLSSKSILALSSYRDILSVDLSNFTDIKNIQSCLEKINGTIPIKKITIAGHIKLPSSGLCPLNNNSAVLSRLSCTAPCHNGNFAVSDPEIGKLFPIAVDGFCRMHMFSDKILDLFKHIRLFQNAGVNEFIVDFSGLSPSLIPVMLNRFLNSIGYNQEYETDPAFCNNHYNLEESLLEKQEIVHT